MNDTSRVFVAGHRGMVGSSLTRALLGKYFVLAKSGDLSNEIETRRFFNTDKPTHVFLAAAKVGGIEANRANPVEFLLENLKIQNSVIQSAAATSVQRLIFLGSSCIYPRDCPQPIREDYLMTGPLEPTNESYALAKIAGLKLCDAYRRQQGLDFFSVMPTNLYGQGDRYTPGCHVIPALIDRFHKARHTDEQVKVWGHPETRREFLYVDDLAAACVLLMNYSGDIRTYLGSSWINIGYGEDISIKALALAVAAQVGLDPERIIWDMSQPIGTPRKWLDSRLINSLGWKPKVDLKEGLRRAYVDYMDRVRVENGQ